MLDLLGGFDAMDAAGLMAAQQMIDDDPWYSPGVYPGDDVAARYAVVDVEPIDETIKRINAERKKSKGGALVKPEGNYKRMGQEADVRMRNEERVAQQLIEEQLGKMPNLRRFGKRAAIGAALAGGAGLAVNSLQGDDLGNAYAKPVFDSALATAMGVGAGGLTGFYTAPAQQTLSLGNQPQAVRVRPLDQYEQLGVARRRGMRGAAIGGAGGALLALASQLRNMDQGRQDELRGY